MIPSVPKLLNHFSIACLEALKDSGLGKYITIGGAVGLSHYYEYRTTKDVAAWWTCDATEKNKQAVISLLKTTNERFGKVTIRKFGDVVSVDLRQDKKVRFNFQIANRSVLLRTPQKSSWYPITLDSLDDLIASKMTALIERGAPRDFLDIYHVSKKRLATISKCWELWKEREYNRGVKNPDLQPGCEALLLHLSRLERLRSLESIPDINDRKNAKTVRNWFKNEFCKGKIKLD